MTEPPEDSTAVVSWETAVPLAGTSRRTVIEYETLGAVAMAVFLFCPWFSLYTQGPALHWPRTWQVRQDLLSDRPTYQPVKGNQLQISEELFHHTR
ncbi:hypothetical protein Sxan_67670 [Streptomyces xanthophaeus]|uniref:Uncharacterized protein n=1 Tax=Streptomyces xanthophaeus TaxID=67385 RepID=A0A919LCD1_9ACTN|nr:hypothetical protein Sxan_67670 [Streptomyces xanthophaeus]